MAYVIVPDGDDDYMTFSLVSLPNDFIITFVGVYLTAAMEGGFANGSGTWIGNPFDNDEWAADLNQSGFEDMVTYAPVIDETLTLILTRVSGTTTMSVNGNLSAGVSNTTTLNLDELFRIGSGFLSNFALETLTVNDNGTDIHKWDATASSHAAGTPTLTDTIGGNDATGVNMATDGSVWVDLGGGGPVTTPLTLSYIAAGASSLSRGLTLSQSHSYSSTGTSSITKQIHKALSFLGLGSLGISKEIDKTVEITATGTLALDEGFITEVATTAGATGTLSTIATFIAKGADAIVGAVKYIAIRLGLGI